MSKSGLRGARTNTEPYPVSWWLAAAAFLLYAALPTKNYYWDGVSFAQDIEQAGKFGSPSFWLNVIHPNHLIYNGIGYCVWASLHAIGLHIRAITVLQAINMVLAAVCVAILQRTLLRITHSSYLSTTLAALFAFSASFWRFATDADAYIPSVLCLLVAFHVLCTAARPRSLLVGILHVCAMLIHQLAIFFFPAAALGIYLKGGRRSLLEYCSLTAGLTLPAYLAGFWLEQHAMTMTTGAFTHWLTFHSADSSFSFNVFRNLGITLANYPRLFFGGTGHVLRFFGPFMLIVLVALAIVIAMLLNRIVRYRDELRQLHFSFDSALPLMVSIVWIAVYAVFLFFWLPSNTFYKLFCLPPIIIVFAHLLMSYQGQRRYRVVLLVATMALANLAFYIFPYSRPDYNQAMRFAARMSRRWSGHTMVYYSDFIVDDWYIRYFNPQTTWKKIEPATTAASFAQEAERDVNSGQEVWLDSTAADALMQNSPRIPEQFGAAEIDNFPKHPIRFYRWGGRAEPLSK